jgi:hypothetical protein
MKSKKIDAKQLDANFDSGEDVLEYFDTDNIERPNQSKRINLELPLWMLQQLDLEATRLGVPRQAVIKFILDEKLKKTG